MIKMGSHLFRAFIFASLAVTLGLALVSYSSFDSSLNTAAADSPHNILGSFGSYIADFFIQLLGLASIFIVANFLFWAKLYFYNHHINYFAARFGGLIVACIALASILSFIPTPDMWPIYIGLGGLTGHVIDKFTDGLLPSLALFSIWSTLFLATSMFSLGLNFSHIERLGNFLKDKFSSFGALLKRKDSNNLEKDDDEESFDDEEENYNEEYEKKEIAEPKAKKSLLKKSNEENQKKLQVVPSKNNKEAPNKAKAIRPMIKQKIGDFMLPDYNLLMKAEGAKKYSVSTAYLENNAKLLKKVLGDFGIEGDIIRAKPGPVVTLYELEPSPGTKSSRVIGLADDIARSMSAVSARISVIPGRNVLGIELPNQDREVVYLRSLMETEEYQDKKIKLPIILGKDISGEPITTDLSRMPHLLVAGTTGSGKSVAINAMILSFIYRLTPDECKFIMIDPKMLELSVYDGIPHLLAPVVTEPAKAVVALKWAVKEMEDRYRCMSYLGVRNIAGYNKRIEEAILSGEKLTRQVQTGFNPETGEPIYEIQDLQMKKLPFIVVIVDEMADLMLTAGKEIESSVQRLAQMARAAGIHMIMATQRPSVDVITGVIKANFPTRISFQVTSRIDSRTILGEMGAEQLLGMGDMLFMAGGNRITRVHGPFVDDKEVDKVVAHLKTQGSPCYLEEVTKLDESTSSGGLDSSGDELYDQAVAIVLRDRKATTSYVQRQLKIGYNRAANLIEQMEREGVISTAGSGGKREILVN